MSKTLGDALVGIYKLAGGRGYALALDNPLQTPSYITGIVRGVSRGERVGNKIQSQSVYWNYTITLNPLNTGHVPVRIVLIQPKVSGPEWQVYYQNGILGPIDCTYKQFDPDICYILKEWRFILDADTKPFQKIQYFMKSHMKITYDDGNTMPANRKHPVMFVLTDATPLDAVLYGYVNYRYKDI